MAKEKQIENVEEPAVVPRIVEAVGSSVGHHLSGNVKLAELIETAQAAAVLQALAEGVKLTDADELIKRKADARERVYAEHGL